MSYRIRQRKNGHYEVDIIVNTPTGERIRERRKSPVTGKDATRRWAEQRERELALHGKRKPEPPKEEKRVPTLREFADEFMAHARTTSKPNTIKAKSNYLRNLLRTFGDVELDRIDARSVARYSSTRLSECKRSRQRAGDTQTVSPQSVNYELGLLRQALTLAVRFGIIDTAPEIHSLPERVKPARFLDLREIERFLAAARADRESWALWALVAVRTGLRTGEQRALVWRNVDLDNKQLIVELNFAAGETTSPKSGRTRKVPLAADVLDALRARRDEVNPRPGELVFTSHRDGVELPVATITHAIRRIGNAAGLGNVNPHALRHAFGSACVARGVPLPLLQQWMGHSRIDTTLVYSQTSPDLGRELIERLAAPAAPTLRLVDGAGVDSPPRRVARGRKT